MILYLSFVLVKQIKGPILYNIHIIMLFLNNNTCLYPVNELPEMTSASFAF